MDRNAIDLTGARVLLVDDVPANLDILYEVLSAEGFEVSLAPSGEIALRIIRDVEALPDVILLDVMMPGLDGFEVCQRLKGDPRTSQIPVIFITAEDQTQSVVRGFEMGGVDYIPKPFRHEEARARVRNALLTKRLFDHYKAHQDKLAQELQTAHDLQMGLMPDASPKLEGFDIAGLCLPAEQVGGDLFQYFPLPDGQVAICLADVTGHAMAAAIPVVLFSGMLQTQIESVADAQELFTRLNDSVRRVLDPRTLVCFAMAQLDPRHHLVRLSNAGCPYPLHFRAHDRVLVELRTDETYPLGASEVSNSPELEVPLEPGDRVVLCSDGIMEAQNGQGDAFGFERTAACVQQACERGLGARTLLEELMDQVRAFAGDTPRTDDQTAVVLEALS